MKRRRQSSPKAGEGMQVIRPQVAGVDVGSREHWVSGPPHADGSPQVRAFGTTTPELEIAVDWMVDLGVESVAMESTGVYWIPLYEMLEARGIEVVLVNVRQLHGVPARKSDVRDCQWLQQLHSCGLLRGSFRPSEAICRMRAVVRERSNLIADRTRIVQRMQEALDQMNVQVHHAVSDLTGKTGMAIVRAIAAGQRDPEVLAELRDPRCRKSRSEIAQHLCGNWREEHLFLLRMGLRRYDELQELRSEFDRQLEQWSAEMTPPERTSAEVAPHPIASKSRAMRRRGEESTRQRLWHWTGVDLTHIDGIGVSAAEIVLTEVGLDLSSFPDESHFVSWLRLSPNCATSGGKPLPRRRNGTGATRVATALRMAALTLHRSPTALGAFFRRIARRKGRAVAVFATARKLAQIIFRALRYGQAYADEGADAYEARFQQQTTPGDHFLRPPTRLSTRSSGGTDAIRGSFRLAMVLPTVRRELSAKADG